MSRKNDKIPAQTPLEIATEKLLKLKEAKALREATEAKEAAEIAELENSVNDARANALRDFAAAQGMSLEEIANCYRVLDKTGSLHPLKQMDCNERKVSVRLTEEQNTLLDKDLQEGTDGIVARCNRLAIKYGPGFQTVYKRAQNLNLTTVRAAKI